jgi:hypothetical protein
VGTGSNRGASLCGALAAFAAFVGVLLGATPGTGIAAAPPDVGEVMLADVGDGWQMTSESEGTGPLSRTFRGPNGELSITGFDVTTPPGVEALFEALTHTSGELEFLPEPALQLAGWLVPPGGSPGDGGVSVIVVASRQHVFVLTLVRSSGSALDGPTVIIELARRQLEAAGGGPVAPAPAAPREVDDAELLAFLPAEPPSGYGLMVASLTLTGENELVTGGLSSPEAADFLKRRSKNVARVWGGDVLRVAVGITEFPYEIFAAAALGDHSHLPLGPLRIDPVRLPPDAITFDDPQQSQVGIVFRRDTRLVTVLAGYATVDAREAAVSLAVDQTDAVAALLPNGSTDPYEFPSPPSLAVGLGFTAALITAAIAGSRAVAWRRAHRVRRRWAAADPPVALPVPGSPPLHVVDLDGGAAALRRSGRWVAGVQLLTVNIGVLALAGDFATAGMVVAAIVFVAGLGFTHWWMRREQGLLGPSGASRRFVFPRLPGVVLGVFTFGVLGVGVSYLLKGVRYLILPPTLAHLGWSDLLGIAPRTVGVAFTLGGLAATFLGAGLFRLARRYGRNGARRVLEADPRPPALYLRSFADDALLLPTISTARRPLFELFSIRGADPFEEPVAWELDCYAPVVAVGRPGGTLRSLGAAREHLDQATWQAEIAHRMQRAGLIVLAPGETAGVEWELGEIVRGGHLHKTVFMFPPVAPADLARRWANTAQHLRAAGARVGMPTQPWSTVHTVRIGAAGALAVTVASTRDEATYRTAVDRVADAVIERSTEPAPAALAGTAPAGGRP